jgi:DNA helicase-2/ATP-dependent DNA helicase PcrA
MAYSSLNPPQQQAVRTINGPVLIIAGPGSGKTHTLVERILHLIAEKGVAPEHILVSTFTEKAAAELITRVSNRLAEVDIRVDLDEMYIGTLHSICLRLLDEYRERTRLKTNFQVWDQFDQQYTLYLKLAQFQDIEEAHHILGDEMSSRWRKAERLCSWLNKVSEELLDVGDISSSANPAVAALGQMYDRYQKLLEEENALDFSTIQVEAYRLLNRNPGIVAELQSRIHYVMIDEFQDTNTVQEAILRLIAGMNGNICVVGDDDQGLYRFRGATIRNILEFPERFSDGSCKRIALTTNYRSHPDIIEFYNAWMESGPWTVGTRTYRFAKVISPRDDTFPESPAVVRLGSAAGIDAWCVEVLRFLRYMRDKGKVTDWNQVAFLFRSVKSQQVTRLADYLEEHGINIYSPRSNMFFDREEIKLVIGALVALFPQLATMFNEQFNDADAHRIWIYYQNCLDLFLDQFQLPGNEELVAWWERHARAHDPFTEETPYNFSRLFYQLLGFPLFARHLGATARGGVIDSRPARNLARMSQILVRYEFLHNINTLQPKYVETDLRRLFRDYFRFLYDGGIEEFEDPEEIAPSGCVSFMTVHQAKGLEFPVVIVGSLWSRPQKGHTDLDEYLQQNHYWKEPFEPFDAIKNFDFWRLFYTAFSRARNLLVLTADEHEGQWANPSKALRPSYAALPSWRNFQKHLAALPIDDVRSVSLKHRYSFTSHIAFFENCARQYQFFRDLDFAPVREGNILFGTLIHQTIEAIHRAAIRGEYDTITESRVEAWFHETYRHLSRSHKSYLNKGALVSALRQVQAYAHRQEGAWDQIRKAEVDVSLVKDQYILSGTVDLIRGEGDTVEVVDFKSDKKPDINAPDDRERLDRYRRQLDVYAHIISQRYGFQVSRVHLYYTPEESGNPYISWPMDTVRLDETIGAIDKVIGRIEHRDYSLAERPLTLCKRCDLRHHCDFLDAQTDLPL